jgi:signal transduction histidine kinase
MNIKVKLALRFTLLVVGILLFFSFLIYYFSYTSRRSRFRENLLVQAQNTAILLINVQEVDSILLIKIQETTRLLEQQEIVITTSADKVIYSYKPADLNNVILKRYGNNIDPLYFTLGEKDGVSYRHILNDQVYHVFVLAYDKYRSDNLQELKRILFWCILFSIWICISVSYFFSRLAIHPISKIISEVKEINSAKLSKRLDEGRGKDEIEQLAVTFNRMLERLEQVFRSQDEFVANASHELRTPLAVMMAESDYILSRDHSKEEYMRHIQDISEDLRKMNQLVDALLVLAHLDSENSIGFREVRIDELLFEAIQFAKEKYPQKKIIPKFEYSEREDDLIIKGDAGLLVTAFSNLLDNACKYSEGEIDVKTALTGAEVIVTVSDQGSGIPESEIPIIFKPFTRASNIRHIGGLGVGLSIVAKILELHQATIAVQSIVNVGTSFMITFRKINRQN